LPLLGEKYRGLYHSVSPFFSPPQERNTPGCIILYPHSFPPIRRGIYWVVTDERGTQAKLLLAHNRSPPRSGAQPCPIKLDIDVSSTWFKLQQAQKKVLGSYFIFILKDKATTACYLIAWANFFPEATMTTIKVLRMEGVTARKILRAY
jgi:hypothetical protein